MGQNSSGFTFQKYGERFIYRIVQVGKKDVLEGKLDKLKDLLDAATKELKASGFVNPWNMTISGYDFDLRHLAQIPEVVAWFRKAQENYPYLPIFLSPFILNAYLLSQIDTEFVQTIKRTNLSFQEKAEIDKVAAILERSEPGLAENYRRQIEFETQYKVDMQQVLKLNAQISFAASLYLGSLEVKEPILAKVLVEAFKRINSALPTVLQD